MTAFNDTQRHFLQTQRLLGRLATVDADGHPHVTPVGWTFDAEHDSIDITGRDLTTTKKYRDVERTGRAAIVIDEVLSPWQPRGIEIRGPAEVIPEPTPTIRIHADRIISWGLTTNQ